MSQEPFKYPEPTKAEFNSAQYAQQLYRDVEHQIRMDPALRSRMQSELDAEVKYQVDKENAAIHQLNTQEIAACSILGVRPSQFILYRTEPK